jgi:hypothetical protein
MLLGMITAAVTEPPPKDVDFKKRVIGGFGSRTPSMGVILWGASPLCFVPVLSLGDIIPDG